MAEVATLRVPGPFVDAFRRAVLEEIEIDAGALEGKNDLEDMRASMRLLDADMKLLEQVEPESDRVEVRSDPETLAHAAETMARKVVGPKLADELWVGPMDSEYVRELRPLVEELTWAIERAAEFHEMSTVTARAA